MAGTIGICRGLLENNVPCDCGYTFDFDRFFLNGTCIDCGHARRLHSPPLPSTAPPADVGQVRHTITHWRKWDEIKLDSDAGTTPQEKKHFNVYHFDIASDGYQIETKMRAFARKETCRVFDALIQNVYCGQKKYVELSGSPGTGKSLIAWHFACYFAKKHSQSVLWITLVKQKVSTGYACGVVVINQFHLYHTVTHPDYIKGILSDVDPTVVIVDGLQAANSSIMDDVYSWRVLKPGCPILMVESMQLVFTDKLSDQKRFQGKYAEILYGQWTLSDFIAACDGDKAFLDQVLPKLNYEAEADVPAKLERKAIMTGMSARYMFDYTVEDIQVDVAKAMCCLDLTTLMKQKLTDNLISFHFPNINIRDRLFVRRSDGSYEASSIYVLHLFRINWCMSVYSKMKDLTESSEESVVMRGIVFEEMFANLLQHSCLNGEPIQVTITTNGPKYEQWFANRLEACRATDGTVQLDKTLITEHVHLWLDPVKFNQKGWNFAEYNKKIHQLRVVQVTVAKSHKGVTANDIKPWADKIVGLGFPIKRYEFVYLYPEGNPAPTVPNEKIGEEVKLAGGALAIWRLATIPWL